MQRLTIEAATRDSALGLYAALERFDVELAESEDGRCHVHVALGRSHRDIIEVLNAIERYVTERHAGAARISLNGRSYILAGAAPVEAQTNPL